MSAPQSPPDPSRAYVVFSQSAGAVDIDAWSAHAARFFSMRIGFASAAPDDLSFVVAPAGVAAGVRSAITRPAQPVDLALAEAAEEKAAAEGGRSGGLALLAKRCGSVWLVERRDPFDVLSLTLAAVLASVLLGPILDPTVPEVFGVKTAREKLAAYMGRS